MYPTLATPSGVCVLQKHVLVVFFFFFLSPKGSPSLQTSGMEGISVLLPAARTREAFLIPQDTLASLGKWHLPGYV